MTKEPIYHKHPMSVNNPMEMKVSIVFDSEDHFRAWVNDRIEEGRAKGQASALVDLQKQARDLFKLVFGKEMG